MLERALKLSKFSSSLFGWNLLLLVVSLILGGAVTMSNGNQLNYDKSQSTIVELDIFSGRTNPTWNLSDTLSQSLVEAVNNFPETEAQAMFEGLGFRGFRVYVTGPEMRGPVSWLVQGEIVEIDLGSTVTYKRDVDHFVEKSLLESAKPFLDLNLFQKIENLINEH
jgi:hypothetical protein